MARKTRQAVKQQDLEQSRDSKVRWLFRLTYLILAASLLLWAWSLISTSNFFPLKQVIIKGQYSKVEPNSIKTILGPYLNTSLWQIKTGTLRHQLQDLPWIQTAHIERSWPNTIVIYLTQKAPIARWHKNALVTADGTVFFPAQNTLPNNLPLLNTPASMISEAANLLTQFQAQVAPIHLQVSRLNLSRRQSISLLLSGNAATGSAVNGSILVLLGQSEINMRLSRFIDVYPNVFAKRLDQVQYADMRYTNGMAVKWKQQ